MTRYRAVLLDIEGTTTPVSFVYEVLFPYALAKLETFFGSPAHRGRDGDLALLREERRAESDPADLPAWGEGTREAADASAAAYLRWLMGRDRKSTGLKSVQGKIWEAGYRRGELRGEVYPDVAPALARWNDAGLRVAIFSSGSALAQELLFRHSTAGDLTRHLCGYFDTSVGSKRDADSYRRIAATLGIAPAQTLFLSDVVAELDAAAVAGMASALCLRGRGPAPAGSAHRAVRRLSEL